MNPGRRLNHAQCHQTIVGTDFFHRAAKMPKFCQNCGFCNRSKLPRSSPDAFVRLIVCVWFPTFCRINGNFIVTDWAKLKGAKNQTEPNRFPPIFTNQKSHTAQLSLNCQFLHFWEPWYIWHTLTWDTLNQERALTTDRLLTNRICEDVLRKC